MRIDDFIFSRHLSRYPHFLEWVNLSKREDARKFALKHYDIHEPVPSIHDILAHRGFEASMLGEQEHRTAEGSESFPPKSIVQPPIPTEENQTEPFANVFQEEVLADDEPMFGPPLKTVHSISHSGQLHSKSLRGNGIAIPNEYTRAHKSLEQLPSVFKSMRIKREKNLASELSTTMGFKLLQKNIKTKDPVNAPLAKNVKKNTEPTVNKRVEPSSVSPQLKQQKAFASSPASLSNSSQPPSQEPSFFVSRTILPKAAVSPNLAQKSHLTPANRSNPLLLHTLSPGQRGTQIIDQPEEKHSVSPLPSSSSPRRQQASSKSRRSNSSQDASGPSCQPKDNMKPSSPSGITLGGLHALKSKEPIPLALAHGLADLHQGGNSKAKRLDSVGFGPQPRSERQKLQVLQEMIHDQRFRLETRQVDQFKPKVNQRPTPIKDNVLPQKRDDFLRQGYHITESRPAFRTSTRKGWGVEDEEEDDSEMKFVQVWKQQPLGPSGFQTFLRPLTTNTDGEPKVDENYVDEVPYDFPARVVVNRAGATYAKGTMPKLLSKASSSPSFMFPANGVGEKTTSPVANQPVAESSQEPTSPTMNAHAEPPLAEAKAMDFVAKRNAMATPKTNTLVSFLPSVGLRPIKKSPAAAANAKKAAKPDTGDQLALW